jgi:sugar lactone lactonase YvrE
MPRHIIDSGSQTISGSLTLLNTISASEYDVLGTSSSIKSTKDVRTWSLGSKTFSIAGKETLPSDLDFKSDGTIMYVVGTVSDAVHAYDLSIPWDVTTSVFSNSKSVSAYDLTPFGLAFSPDGVYMFILGDTGNQVGRYTLPTPWNPSSNINVSIDAGQTFTITSLVPTATVPTAICFNPTGTRMYITDDNNNTAYQYNLSAAWDLTTVSYPSISLSLASVETNPTGIAINKDGSRLFVTGGQFQTVQEFSLPTPYSLSGAVYVGRMQQVTEGETTPTGLYYNDNVDKAFFIGTTTDLVIEITVTPQLQINDRRPFINALSGVAISDLTISSTTASTNTSTGALKVAGGLGVRGEIYVAGILTGSSVGSFNVVRTASASYFEWGSTSSRMYAPSNGVIRLSNTANNDFDRLQFGGITSSFPSIKKSGTELQIRTADDTLDADLKAAKITATKPIVFPALTTGVISISYPPSSYIGGMLYVTDEVGGPTMAFSDGTNWRRVQDRAIIAPSP